jgi:hypothetical protein
LFGHRTKTWTKAGRKRKHKFDEINNATRVLCVACPTKLQEFERSTPLTKEKHDTEMADAICRFRVHRASKLKILVVGGQVRISIDLSAEKEGDTEPTLVGDT